MYVNGAKIAALGIRVRRGRAFHGLAFNIAGGSVAPFGRINPCGYEGLRAVALSDLGGPSALEAVKPVLLDRLAAQFGLAMESGPHPISLRSIIPLPHAERGASRVKGNFGDNSAMSSTPRNIPLAVVGEAPSPLEPGARQVAGDKIARSPVQFVDAPVLRKPSWIRVRIPSGNAVQALKAKLRENRLVTVCEDASCPNIHECFGHGTATFMVMGDVCTRRCSFCDVAHGRPKPLDADEPHRLAATVADMGLKYVVITSVDRDDLRDGGAQHFVDCIRETRAASPGIRIEILTPDFRGKGRMERALEILAASRRRTCSTTTSRPCPTCTATCGPARTTSGR